MHQKQHQIGFLFSSQLAREASKGSQDGVQKASPWRLNQKKEHTVHL